MQHVARLKIVVLLTVLVALTAALGASWARAKKPKQAAHGGHEHHAPAKGRVAPTAAS